MLRADFFNDTIINFARQQTQRKPNNAGRILQHPLNGEMRLAGIGRTQNSHDARGALGWLERRRRRGWLLHEGDIHVIQKP